MSKRNRISIDAAMDLDVESIYWQGETKKQEEHDAVEAGKLGSYRVGSSGLLLEDGTVTGTCPRKAYLRYKGIQWEEKDQSSILMMEGGVWNEAVWVDVLKRSWPGQIKQEEECPVEFELSDGTKITGRPDVLLCDADGTPRKGLELKNASSVWTGRDVLTEIKPKVDHLIQAGMYMYGLRVPFDLCYVSRVKYAVPTKNWIERLFPRPGQPGSEWMEYNEKGGSKALKPFLRVFPLRMVDGVVEYWHPVEEVWMTTLVSLEKIFRYYDGVHSMNSHDQLPARPVVLKLDGSTGYDPCNPAYCPLADTCDRWESKGKAAWEDAVQLFAKGEADE